MNSVEINQVGNEVNIEISYKLLFLILCYITGCMYVHYFRCTCIMCFLGVLMSRSKSNTKTVGDNSSFVSQTTAAMLQQAGVIDYCLTLLKALLQYWKR